MRRNAVPDDGSARVAPLFALAWAIPEAGVLRA